MRNFSKIAFAFTLGLLVLFVGTASADLVIDQNYHLISKTRVGRTVYDYAYQVNITNNGSDAQNVTATVTSSSGNTTIIDGNVVFGGVAAGATVTGTDTFTIRQDRSYTFDPASLSWDVLFTQNPTTPVVYEEGSEVSEVTENISPAGGTLTVDDPSSPIFGVVVEFPGGALGQNTDVTLGYTEGTLEANSGDYSGVNILLNVSGVEKFSQPVTITVPFNDPNRIPIPYYITAGGHIRPAQLLRVDRISGTFTFQTFHASVFTWISGLIISDQPDTLVDTGFDPDEDGFRVTNNGSSYNRGGECFGMTSFALWYYMDHKADDGNLYPRFYSILGQDSAGDNVRGQDIIATRSFISISQQWTTYIPAVAREQGLTHAERYATIRNIIDNTMNPVLIYLYHTTGGSAHSVLAYSYDSANGDISIYDPNHPGSTRTIQYDVDTDTFGDYSGYDGIVYNGDGSLSLTEPYTNILEDAENFFNSSTMPNINITSHSSGGFLTTHNTTLSGTIESAEVLVSRLIVHVGSVAYTTDVPTSGNFSIPVSLENGVNHLVFTLEGEDSGGNLIAISPTNMDTTDFTIEVISPNSMILMTLTWDKNDTDLDTYVIDPTGDYSAYYHMTTSDGGELDFDDTNGFGPEHWTLMNTDTVRYDQPYRFRVHYYSDHGNGGTNYTVSIKLYEGTSREITHTYTGYLAVSSPGNNSPTATGADWVDIAEITLTGGVSTSPLSFTAPSNARMMSFSTSFSTPLVIPSIEESNRMKESSNFLGRE